ncbi:hypothetical protein PGB90_000994 [Kerria lacca]
MSHNDRTPSRNKHRVLSEKETQKIADEFYLSSDDDEEDESESDFANSSDAKSNSSTAVNDQNVSNTSNNVNNQNVGSNIAVETTEIVNQPLPDPDDWCMGITKPTLLKFKGKEEVHYPHPQPVVQADFSKRSPLNNFKPITYQEFYKFLGLCILIGNVAMPSMKHYWSVKNKLYSHPIFGQAMPRKKFELILRTLRFYDTDQKVEKKNKIEMKHELSQNKEVQSKKQPLPQMKIDCPEPLNNNGRKYGAFVEFTYFPSLNLFFGTGTGVLLFLGTTCVAKDAKGL